MAVTTIRGYMSNNSGCIKTLVSIVAPIFNEEGSIEEFLQRIFAAILLLADKYEFECVLVDDGSADNSLALIKKLLPLYPTLKLIELRSNSGQTAALQAGLDHANGEIIITLDADLQHFPEEISSFLEKIEDGYDVVCGWRYDRQEDIVRRWPSKIANYLIRKLTKLSINDVGTTYRAYRREITQDVKLFGENHRFIPVFASVAGAKICEVKIKNVVRQHGASNYNISRTLNVFIDLFFLYFVVNYLDRPLRIFGKFAIALFVVATVIFSCLLYIFVNTNLPVVRVHSGWFTLSVMFYVVGIQLFLIGMVAEVLSRIYFATGNKTVYKIRNVWTSKIN